MLEAMVECGREGLKVKGDTSYGNDISHIEMYKLKNLTRRELIHLMNFLNVRINVDGVPVEALDCDEMRMEYLYFRKKWIDEKYRKVEEKRRRKRSRARRVRNLIKKYIYEPLKYT